MTAVAIALAGAVALGGFACHWASLSAERGVQAAFTGAGVHRVTTHRRTTGGGLIVSCTCHEESTVPSRTEAGRWAASHYERNKS